MKDIILKNSKAIENLSNTLGVTEALRGNTEAKLILDEIKANNYSILDCLDKENFEITCDSKYLEISKQAETLLKDLSYINGSLGFSDDGSLDWVISSAKPSEAIKMVGWHSIEESQIVWGSNEHSTLVLSRNSSNTKFIGLILRTVDDTKSEFECNLELKVNFCTKPYFVKELESNLFIVIFPVDSEKGDMEVDLYYSNVGSPFDKGIGEDKRALSVCLTSISSFSISESR